VGKLRPLRDYLVVQGRFRKITEEQVNWLQGWVNARWQRFQERAARHKAPSPL